MRPVLLTGVVGFADGRKPRPLDAAAAPPGKGGGTPADAPPLFEYPELVIAVRARAGIRSTHRAVVSEEGRFGFQIPVPAERETLEQVAFTCPGCRPVTLEEVPIGSGGPVGAVCDLGTVVLEAE